MHQGYGTRRNSIPFPPPWNQSSRRRFSTTLITPQKTVTIQREELYKLREHGGAKLVHAQAKSEASKVQWLIDLCINPTLSGHLALVTELLGDQGNSTGRTCSSPANTTLSGSCGPPPPFYQEAIRAITALDVRKRVLDLRAEKLFHNPVLTFRQTAIASGSPLTARWGLYLRATPRRGSPPG